MSGLSLRQPETDGPRVHCRVMDPSTFEEPVMAEGADSMPGSLLSDFLGSREEYLSLTLFKTTSEQ